MILGAWNSGERGEATFHLREIIDGWNDPFVIYAYNLILQATACEESRVRIDSFFIETTGEVSRGSLPEPNKTPWVLRSVGSRETPLQVEVTTEQGPEPPPAPVIRSLDKVTKAGQDLKLSWTVAHSLREKPMRQTGSTEPEPVDSALTFDVEISDDSRFRWKLLPLMNLREDPGATSWTLPGDLLPPQGIHYWRVRSRTADGSISPWSRVARIRYLKP